MISEHKFFDTHTGNMTKIKYSGNVQEPLLPTSWIGAAEEEMVEAPGDGDHRQHQGIEKGHLPSMQRLEIDEWSWPVWQAWFWPTNPQYGGHHTTITMETRENIDHNPR
jgi:hypothetical protein